MNQKLIIFSGIGLLILGIAVLVLLFVFSPKKEPVTNTPSTTFPVATSTGQGIGTLQIQSRGTTTITTTDFTHNGITVQDVANPGNYFLQGSLGYCLGDGTCPRAGTANDFSVAYSDKYETFTISLLSEPIGLARLHAEEFLKRTLGLTEKQLCALKYSVNVVYFVNSTYTGQNLGFSFCPGAVKLPS